MSREEMCRATRSPALPAGRLGEVWSPERESDSRPTSYQEVALPLGHPGNNLPIVSKKTRNYFRVFSLYIFFLYYGKTILPALQAAIASRSSTTVVFMVTADPFGMGIARVVHLYV